MNGILNSSTVMVLFDVLITILGGYIIFCAYKMKKSDDIPPILLTAKEIQICKRPYDFVDYMFPFTMIFGCVCFIFGVFNILADVVLHLPSIATGISVIILIGVWIWFSQMLRNAKRRFL